jgi:hypothetical protein
MTDCGVPPESRSLHRGRRCCGIFLYSVTDTFDALLKACAVFLTPWLVAVEVFSTAFLRYLLTLLCYFHSCGARILCCFARVGGDILRIGHGAHRKNCRESYRDLKFRRGALLILLVQTCGLSFFKFQPWGFDSLTIPIAAMPFLCRISAG